SFVGTSHSVVIPTTSPPACVDERPPSHESTTACGSHVCPSLPAVFRLTSATKKKKSRDLNLHVFPLIGPIVPVSGVDGAGVCPGGRGGVPPPKPPGLLPRHRGAARRPRQPGARSAVRVPEERRRHLPTRNEARGRQACCVPSRLHGRPLGAPRGAGRGQTPYRGVAGALHLSGPRRRAGVRRAAGSVGHRGAVAEGLPPKRGRVGPFGRGRIHAQQHRRDPGGSRRPRAHRGMDSGADNGDGQVAWGPGAASGGQGVGEVRCGPGRPSGCCGRRPNRPQERTPGATGAVALRRAPILLLVALHPRHAGLREAPPPGHESGREEIDRDARRRGARDGAPPRVQGGQRLRRPVVLAAHPGAGAHAA
ncbi:unnamed protein product, partial [Ectocarpus sp. 12 AP-2014]